MGGKRLAMLAAGAAVITTAAVVPAAYAGGSGHTEYFRLVTNSTSSNAKPSVIATGFFTAGGTDEQVNNDTDVFHFGNGSLVVHHPHAHQTQSFNPKTCLFRLTLSGKYTLNKGTGAYKGITGSGRYRGLFLGIAKRTAKGTCNTSESAPLRVSEEVITAHGTVSRS